MSSNRMAFAAVSLACVVAAAGASYIATRQNQASSALAAPAVTPANAASQSAATTAPAAPATEPTTAAVPVPDAQPASGSASSSSASQAAAKAAAVVRPSDNPPASKNRKPEAVIARSAPATPCTRGGVRPIGASRASARAGRRARPAGATRHSFSRRCAAGGFAEAVRAAAGAREDVRRAGCLSRPGDWPAGRNRSLERARQG